MSIGTMTVTGILTVVSSMAISCALAYCIVNADVRVSTSGLIAFASISPPELGYNCGAGAGAGIGDICPVCGGAGTGAGAGIGLAVPVGAGVAAPPAVPICVKSILAACCPPDKGWHDSEPSAKEAQSCKSWG